jgi:hypothetical protein
MKGLSLRHADDDITVDDCVVPKGIYNKINNKIK